MNWNAIFILIEVIGLLFINFEKYPELMAPKTVGSYSLRENAHR
jgi:hypothetical protein